MNEYLKRSLHDKMSLILCKIELYQQGVKMSGFNVKTISVFDISHTSAKYLPFFPTRCLVSFRLNF